MVEIDMAMNEPTSSDHLTQATLRERMAREWMRAQPALLAFLVAASPQFSDAEDLLQDVAADVAFRFDQYDQSRPFVPWAIGIAKKRIADFYRSRQKQNMVFVGESIDILAEACQRTQEILGKEKWALDRCVSQLTERSRELIQLRYAEDLAPRDIAARLGMTAGAVRVSLSRIRTTLLECAEAALQRGSITHERT